MQVLDIVFFVFHTGLVLFNVLGWIWPKTRRWNLYTLLATAGSWFVMGIWYGLGYCLCTDWHFQVRRQLGYQDDSPTYIHLMIKMLTGADLDPGLVQTGTALGFVFGLVMSLITNFALRKPSNPEHKPA
ncbi:MAG: DUF2784 family protein [Chlorobia bacterium]|nr:DUF2784 family protein [Fimbriimonadaceae bacterium]